MAKIKFTKGELKHQRDLLTRYERYLPTLQLKKQQLQMEILRHVTAVEEKRRAEELKRADIVKWAGLLSEPTINIREWVIAERVLTEERNIAGIDIPIFIRVEFAAAEYDLYLTPFWLDGAIESLRTLASMREEISTLEKCIDILRQELRITAQRVNLFEKVKIPEAKEAIRRIKIHIGDQMTNAVGRSKIAKRKIEFAELEGAFL